MKKLLKLQKKLEFCKLEVEKAILAHSLSKAQQHDRIIRSLMKRRKAEHLKTIQSVLKKIL